MALNTQQQAAFNRQIGRMKEDGFFLPAQRSLSGDTRYLIIGYGGTGAAALFGVKKQFEAILPKQQLEERVRFLAIDTDKATKESTRERKNPDGTVSIEVLDSLSNDQFVQLSGQPARLCLADDKVAEWINPKLKDRITHDSTLLNGDGASGTRQIGRLTLYPPQNVATVTAKVRKLAAELTDDNPHSLCVFILSGIAGGTGSGTVIDLTYLIRNTLENMPGNVDDPQKNVPTRSKYCGFLLLPPTGNSKDPVYIRRGNRNGYAALKEVNHFMNIDARLGKYRLVYGNGNVVTSSKNIFDICYLLDGNSDVASSNPREKAIGVLAESILDMVCASQTDSTGMKIQSVDSFMNDQSTTRAGMIASKSFKDAMRDADYIYCALGHSEFAMPIHEIKAYVAKQMFDRIYKLFLNCQNVEEEDVEGLLKNILRKGAATGSATVRNMNEELELWFTNPRGGKGGPYFTINLLSDLVELIRRQRNKVRLFRIGTASDEELDNIEKYALHVNNTTFNVYTAAMEALKGMMDDQFGVVVKAGTSGNTYSFIPASMGGIGNTEYVIKYLDGLINNASLYQLTEAMLREMMDNKEAWTSLVRSDDPTAAPNAMRRFWNEQLDKIITSTLEDFLIKYYSGDPTASYSMETHDQTYPYLEQAANAIYKEMLGKGGKAQPMAELTGNGLQPSDFNGHTYLMVPECAPNLCSELKKIAAGAPAGLQVDVCTSMASDRISCYMQYTSIPAFKLKWACAAEEDYEREIKTDAGVGTHMSETAGGNQWKSFPNLLPKSSWGMLPKTGYTNSREGALAERAETLFDQSKKMKLTSVMTSASGVQSLVYTVKVLPKEYRPEDALFRDLDRCVDDTDLKKEKLAAIDAAAEQRAKLLFDKVSGWETDTQVPKDLAEAGVAFEERELSFSDSILTIGPNDDKPADWDEYMAKCMLRKLPDVMNEVSGTVMVMEKLITKIGDVLRRKTLVSQFAHYLITGMFVYNEEKKRWQYTDEDEISRNLVTLKQKQEPLFEYYLMFNAFRNDSEAIVKSLAAQLKAVAPLIEDDEPCKGYDEKEKKFEENARKLRAELKDWIQEMPIEPYIKGLESLGYKTKAIKNFYRTLFVEVKDRVTFGFNQDMFFPNLSSGKFDDEEDDIDIELDDDDEF